MVKFEWWKWPFWIKIAGQILIIVGVWKVAKAMSAGDRPSRAEMLPWLVGGLLLYYAGRVVQMVARSRQRRLDREAKLREDS